MCSPAAAGCCCHCRMTVNDGMHTATMMLAMQLELMAEGTLLQDGTLLRVDEVIPNELAGRK